MADTTRLDAVGSGGTAVGSGTLLVLLAQNLPQDNRYRPWMLILAPSITVAIGWLWSRVLRLVSRSLKRRSMRRAREEVLAALSEMIARPDITPAQRKELERKRHEIDIAHLDDIMKVNDD